jgi:glycosyltransferase involved in cell wall biosynthesis
VKPKILFLLQIPPPVHGAALRNLSLVQSALLQRVFDIELLPLRFAQEIRDIGALSVRKMWRLACVLGRLVSVLTAKRPRFVYFTLTPAGNAFYRDVLLVALIRLFCVPLVYHLRGLGIKEASRRRFDRALYRFVFSGAYVVCLAKTQLAELDGFACRHVFVVPNGIKREAQPRPFVAREIPQVLYLSNYVRSKGVIDFIEACRKLRQSGVPFVARTVGASWDVSEQQLRDLTAEYGLSEQVTIGGPLFGAEKFEAIRQADIFVFPTYMPWELFPGVLLEAMQCAKPIVTTPTGAIPEIITDNVNGMLVAAKDPAELAKKIEVLIGDASLRRRLGEAAHAKFNDCYTLERFEANMCSVFETVLGSEGVSSGAGASDQDRSAS